MNDTMVVSGSAAGIVKLWDLPKLLDMPVRMISARGVILFIMPMGMILVIVKGQLSKSKQFDMT